MDNKVHAVKALLEEWLRFEKLAVVEELEKVASFFLGWNLQDDACARKIQKSANCILRGTPFRQKLLKFALELHEFEEAVTVTSELLDELDSRDYGVRSERMTADDYVRFPLWLRGLCESICW